ncbi:PIN-like domain-containing protein [Nocardia sp. NPDC047648]|uniref:PIN-like domain-containing protein n=1 Tax=Nocardia sp. NPDC047648 TaxID=3155625 RepID=UPI0033E8B73F
MADAGSPSRRRFVDEFSAWLKLEDPAKTGSKIYFETAMIVVDTNVLLDLYRVSSATRQEIVDVLSRIKEQLWIPYQVALEYSRNRRKAVIDRNKQFSEIGSVLRNSENGAIEKLEDALSKFLKFREKNRSSRVWDPVTFGVDKEGIRGRIRGIWQEALKELGELEAEIDLSVEDLAADPILAQLDDLLTGRVGDLPSAKDLQEHVEHALEFRYPNKIPPGYADVNDKDTPVRQAGDYLVWRQLIDHLKIQDTTGVRRVMLVTGDSKADWWELDRAGNPINPRPELVHELRHEANAELLLLSLTQLLQGAKDHLDYQVSDAAISEVQEQEEADQLRALLPDIVLNSNGPINLTDLHHIALEKIVMYFLVSIGWEVSRHVLGASSRVDFIAIDSDGQRVAIDVKMRRNVKMLDIDIKQLQYAAQHMDHENPIDRCLLVTTAAITPAVSRFLETLDKVEVIDGPALCNLLKVYCGLDVYISGI